MKRVKAFDIYGVYLVNKSVQDTERINRSMHIADFSING